MKKVFIIACESSGDHHGAELIRAIQRKAPDMEIEYRGLGGPLMERAGVRLEEDMTKISALGFSDVLRQYLKYRKIFYNALDVLKLWKPDTVILIDSPAFNLRFAKKVRPLFPKVPVLYYIAPQLWAWGGRRIHVVKRTITEMLVILPFEKELYDKASIPCRFVGHPLLDKIAPSVPETKQEAQIRLHIPLYTKVIGLMPGSRASEVKRILPILKDSAERLAKVYPDIHFLVARAPGVPKSIYEDILCNSVIHIHFFDSDFYDHIRAMDFALVASGTATLETALLGTPFFLIYKASASTYFLGRWLVKVKYLGLANLLLNKPAVPEFIQDAADPEKIATMALELLRNDARIAAMKEDFVQVRKTLGDLGASSRAAAAVISYLRDVR